MLSFNFGSRTSACKRLARGSNLPSSAFTSVIRKYLDTVVKAYLCVQYIDDIGVVAKTASELIENLEHKVQQIKKGGFKFFLEPTISKAGIAPIGERITMFLKNLQLPSSVKALQRYLGFVQLHRQNFPRRAVKLAPLHLRLRKDVSFKPTQQQITRFSKRTNACSKHLNCPWSSPYWKIL